MISEPDTDCAFETVDHTSDCPECGVTHTVKLPRLFYGGRRQDPWRCDACRDRASERQRQEADEHARKEKAGEWARICPREYQTEAEGGNTVESRLDLAAIQATNGTRMARHDVFFGGECRDSGIWLAGESGAMKTRLAWRIVRRVFDGEKTSQLLSKSLQVFSAWSFQSAYQDAQGRFEISAWMDGLCDCRLVFLDDIGKVEWSPNAAAAFFEMVERRTSNGKWLLFTSNHTRGDLGTMFGQSKSHATQGSADAITRRLKEFCAGYLVTKNGGAK